ncbi:hypothetical protein BD769DRAFT_753208 [Suillus cothurnatus]|nr:hypothetical protein BD769DRAFT_753208 [Suillus cothurnatus]
MGGTLARPQDHRLASFTDSFGGNYSYFLPCAVAACLLFPALFMMVFFLNETLSTKRRPKLTSVTVGVSSGKSLPPQSMANISLRSLLTPAVVIPIANYAIFASLEIFPQRSRTAVLFDTHLDRWSLI